MKYLIRWCVKRLRFFSFSCHAWSRDFVEASTSTTPHHSMYDNHNHNATATATTWQPTAIVIPTPRPWGICKREGAGRLGMTKTGPNNVRRVIWALGEFFFLFLSCLIMWLCWSININNATSFNVRQPQPQCNSNRHHSTTNSHHHSNTQALGDMQEGGCWKVGNDQNRPKWCETHRLGPRWVFFFFFCVILY